jgi:probable DNA metabolism protein
LIRDRKRSETLVWDTENWHITELPVFMRPALPKDSEFEELWKGYFKTAAIPWRVNKKLQRHFVPQRYRRYLTEFL